MYFHYWNKFEVVIQFQIDLVIKWVVKNWLQSNLIYYFIPLRLHAICRIANAHFERWMFNSTAIWITEANVNGNAIGTLNFTSLTTKQKFFYDSKTVRVINQSNLMVTLLAMLDHTKKKIWIILSISRLTTWSVEEHFFSQN